MFFSRKSPGVPAAEPAPNRLPLWNAARTFLQRRTTLVEQLTRRLNAQSQQDVRAWRQAVAQAESPQRPDRRPLLQLQHACLLDAHLTGILRVRRERMRSAQARLVASDGSAPPEANALLHSPWFDTLVDALLDAELMGYALLELAWDPDTGLEAFAIPPAHVQPDWQLLALDASAPLPTSPQDLPADSAWRPLSELPHTLILLQGSTPLGLLASAVPYVLAKRNTLACWGEFAEIFGMPLRIGRTQVRDERHKQQLAEALKQMGAAAYAVLDDTDQIEFVQAQQGDAFRVYDRLIERCNLELSKLILGQTLTTEPGDRGARALGDIHDNILDDLTRADLRRIETAVNRLVLPRLAALPPLRPLLAGLQLQYDSGSATLSPREQWQIDAGLLQHYDVPAAYFRAKYQVPVQDRS